MASDFTRRQNVILGIGLGIGILGGIGLTLGFIALHRKLKAPSLDIRDEILALRRDVELIQEDLNELSKPATGNRSEQQSVASEPAVQKHLLRQLRKSSERMMGSIDKLSMTLPNASSTPKCQLSRHISDDDEFLDAIDDETPAGTSSGSTVGTVGEKFDPNSESFGENPDLPALYAFVDQCLNDTNVDTKQKAYDLMKRVLRGNTSRHSSDSVFLCRFSRAASLYADTLSKDGINAERKKELVFEAKSYAFAALELNGNDAEIHKMCALALGMTKDYISISDSILMGFEYKKHIDLALAQRPTDSVLLYLSGRWCWAIAELSWLERKAASALFANPPTSSYDEALHCFLEAEKGNNEWIANKCYIAKCYVALGEPKKSEPFVREGLAMKPCSAEDESAYKELLTIAAKYKITSKQ